MTGHQRRLAADSGDAAGAAGTHAAIDLAGSLAVFATAVNFVIVPLLTRYLTGYLDTWTQNAFRYATAFVVWAPFVLVRVRQGRIPRRIWTRAIVPTVLNLVQQVLLTAGFYYIDPAFASLLGKTSLIWIMLFAMIVFPDERALLRNRLFLTGVPLCVAGAVGVMVLQRGFSTGGTAIGIVLTLGCALSWGAYTVSARYFLRDYDPRTAFAVIAVYTTIALFALALLLGDPLHGLRMPLAGWAAVSVSGFAAIAVGHVLYFVAIKRIGATITALFLLITPLGVYGVSARTFGETMNLAQGLSGIVLLAGAGLVLWSQKSLRSAR
jgi:drug/metabolite transporter (DMT)-like permease